MAGIRSKPKAKGHRGRREVEKKRKKRGSSINNQKGTLINWLDGSTTGDEPSGRPREAAIAPPAGRRTPPAKIVAVNGPRNQKRHASRGVTATPRCCCLKSFLWKNILLSILKDRVLLDCRIACVGVFFWRRQLRGVRSFFLFTGRLEQFV